MPFFLCIFSNIFTLKAVSTVYIMIMHHPCKLSLSQPHVVHEVGGFYTHLDAIVYFMYGICIDSRQESIVLLIFSYLQQVPMINLHLAFN